MILRKHYCIIPLPYAWHTKGWYNVSLNFKSIGLRVQHARKKRGLTQEQLAAALDIGRRHIGFIETGSRGISLEILVSISNILQVPITDLLADNLTSSSISESADLNKVLLDCNKQEEQIIIKTAEALKAVLFEFGV